MTKPTIFYDPVLFGSRATRLSTIANALQARIAELEALPPQTVTVEVPVDRIVEVEVPGPERIVEVEVEVPVDSGFNATYIQILRDHIKDLNDFIVNQLSEGSS